MKFLTNALLEENPTIHKLTVLSYEMNIYFVSLKIGFQEGLLYEDGKPKRFNSAQQIRDYFASFKVRAAEMQHESPYDEMIGNPPSAQSLGSLPFSMQSGLS